MTFKIFWAAFDCLWLTFSFLRLMMAGLFIFLTLPVWALSENGHGWVDKWVCFIEGDLYV